MIPIPPNFHGVQHNSQLAQWKPRLLWVTKVKQQDVVKGFFKVTIGFLGQNPTRRIVCIGSCQDFVADLVIGCQHHGLSDPLIYLLIHQPHHHFLEFLCRVLQSKRETKEFENLAQLNLSLSLRALSVGSACSIQSWPMDTQTRGRKKYT